LKARSYSQVITSMDTQGDTAYELYILPSGRVVPS